MNSSRLVYVTDPLCLWCYGISSVIEDFYQQLPVELTTETINGGLFPAFKAKKCDRAFIDYLQTAAQRVTQMTGKIFSSKFWDLLATHDFYYDTEPSAMATVTVQKYCGEEAMLRYSHALQEAFFVGGENVMHPETLMLLAEPFGLSQEDFLTFYLTEECMDLTRKQYAEAKQIGVNSFPALLYIDGSQGYSLSAGYSTLEDLTKAFNWARLQCLPVESATQNVCSEKGCVS